jgi:hypothetical protein
MAEGIQELLAVASGIRLDIGCGENKQPGFVGMDVRELPGVDVVHDVNQHPWPLPDECALLAMCSHLVEHIPPVAIGGGGTWFPFMAFMDEVWRVLKSEASLLIVCPHAMSIGYAQDPTHCNPCNEATWAYFDPSQELYQIYRPKPWRIQTLSWNPSANVEVALCKMP